MTDDNGRETLTMARLAKIVGMGLLGWIVILWLVGVI